ncbi:hypothetical protein HDV64DRAFT_13092 [Trichoderma sp. TUCIM 5745]
MRDKGCYLYLSQISTTSNRWPTSCIFSRLFFPASPCRALFMSQLHLSASSASVLVSFVGAVSRKDSKQLAAALGAYRTQ